jgi:RNA polymerase sigma factor (sigma-70 family)
MAHQESTAADLVRAARSGDEHAWTELYHRLEPRLRREARRYRLGPAQVDDVVQTAWLRLFEHVDQLREPQAVAGWLLVVVRREAFRTLQGHVRELVTDDPLLGERAEHEGPEEQLLRAERDVALADAIGALPERHRRLMQSLLRTPDASYREVSAQVGIPVGSIGPTRGRCLTRMAGDPALRSLHVVP